MFITDFVRNVAWSLRQTAARRAQRDDSVLPADAVAPVAPVRRERERRTAQELADERARSSGEPQRVAIVGELAVGPGAPPEAAGQAAVAPHIDIKV